MRLRLVALALAVISGLAVRTTAQERPDPFTAPDIHKSGPGLTNPIVLHEEKPKYTQDAMRAKIQGIVQVECIVLANGLVGDVRTFKSLDKVFGLDLEALNAAKRWRFKPALLKGEPVKSVVIIELEFRLSPNPDDSTFGLGAHRPPVSGLVAPKVTRDEKPEYTQAARDRKIQGLVQVEAVVGPDGKVERARIAKSLDTEHGLDKQALIAAHRWSFEPGTLNGKPVPVIVIIELEFRLK